MSECPLCEQPLERPDGCRCGWTADAAASAQAMAQAVDAPEVALAALLGRYQASRKRWPSVMPERPHDAARWWLALQEPPGKDERPRLVRSRTSGEERVESAYARRVQGNLALFLDLPPHAQQMVVAAAEDGIWWRGEPMWQFERFTLPEVLEAQRLREEHPAEWRRMVVARARDGVARLSERLTGKTAAAPKPRQGAPERSPA